MFSTNGITILRYEEILTRLRRVKAFWARINYEDKNKIFNPTLWAQGITLSKFFYKAISNNKKDRTFSRPTSSSSPNARNAREGGKDKCIK